MKSPLDNIFNAISTVPEDNNDGKLVSSLSETMKLNPDKHLLIVTDKDNHDTNNSMP